MLIIKHRFHFIIFILISSKYNLLISMDTTICNNKLEFKIPINPDINLVQICSDYIINNNIDFKNSKTIITQDLEEHLNKIKIIKYRKMPKKLEYLFFKISNRCSYRLILKSMHLIDKINRIFKYNAANILLQEISTVDKKLFKINPWQTLMANMLSIIHKNLFKEEFEELFQNTNDKIVNINKLIKEDSIAAVAQIEKELKINYNFALLKRYLNLLNENYKLLEFCNEIDKLEQLKAIIISHENILLAKKNSYLFQTEYAILIRLYYLVKDKAKAEQILDALINIIKNTDANLYMYKEIISICTQMNKKHKIPKEIYNRVKEINILENILFVTNIKETKNRIL